MDDKIEVIKNLELSLLDPIFRKSREYLNSLVADDFTEFGSSGKIYNKQNILENLPLEKSSEFVIQDLQVKQLSGSIMLVTYQTESEYRALRSSIWRFEDNNWRIVFHQGTKINES
jgi:hypothetical protein